MCVWTMGRLLRTAYAKGLWQDGPIRDQVQPLEFPMKKQRLRVYDMADHTALAAEQGLGSRTLTPSCRVLSIPVCSPADVGNTRTFYMMTFVIFMIHDILWAIHNFVIYFHLKIIMTKILFMIYF